MYIFFQGFVKLGDWEPISLNNICSINQCFDRLCDHNTKYVTEKTKMKKKDSDSVSVYDILKQVISLISVNIRVKLR